MAEQFECEDCGSVYPSVRASIICCAPETDARYELGNN
jgi:hypothetical protein